MRGLLAATNPLSHAARLIRGFFVSERKIESFDVPAPLKSTSQGETSTPSWRPKECAASVFFEDERHEDQHADGVLTPPILSALSRLEAKLSGLPVDSEEPEPRRPHGPMIADDGTTYYLVDDEGRVIV